ncbi:uncharacterized protein LOC121870234 [Homarus americanus]|uniref:uncharacterized protein LOC121870234 n=1 Tax=Homarus americanus TaxID=6706 RepID=UPI001C46E771|nr:uncharacterized protein LOC121870234 [Homarus americanus]
MQDLRSSPYAILQQECVSVLDPHLSFDMDLLAATLGGSPNTLCYDGEGGTFCKDSGHAASGMAAVSGLGEDGVTGHLGEDWVTGHLGEDGVTGHLGEDGVTGHLGEDWVTGHLGEDGVTGHLGEDWVTGHLGEQPQVTWERTRSGTTGHLAAAWPEDDYLSLGTTDPSLVLRTQDMEQSWLDDHLMLLSQDQLLNPETSQLYENHEELPQNHSFNPDYTSVILQDPTRPSSPSFRNLSGWSTSSNVYFSDEMSEVDQDIYTSSDTPTNTSEGRPNCSSAHTFSTLANPSGRLTTLVSLSGHAPSALATPSRHAPSALATPSRHAPSALTTPSGHAPSALATPSRHAPSALATPSRHAPSALATPSGHALSALATPSRHAPSALTTPSGHAPSALATPSGHALSALATPSGHSPNALINPLSTSRKGYHHRNTRKYLKDPNEKKLRSQKLNNESSKLHRNKKKENIKKTEILEQQLQQDQKQLTLECQQLEDHLHWCREMYKEHISKVFPLT